MQKLTIKGIEAAINECSRLNLKVDKSLSPDANALADIYGSMIYEKAEEIDFARLVEKGVFGESHLKAIEKYYKIADS